MKKEQKILAVLAAALVILAGWIGGIFTVINATAGTPEPSPTPQIATAAQLEQARKEWELSAHADTYDEGVGANTTCAKCKSPQNWDPFAPSAGMELNCASCKRVPGAPRPDLESGIPVPTQEWRAITCEICHQPIGDSYSTSIAFWDQLSEQYLPVESTAELCTHCHEGRHGFQVIEEQTASIAHQGWDCTRCHGAHGAPSACTDCHNPQVGAGASEHARHPQVNCTACHDAGGLSMSWEDDPNSKFSGQLITRRFAHTITSWPSHNLRTEVVCGRCHHRRGEYSAAVVNTVDCSASGCHSGGAVLNWCPALPRDIVPQELTQP